MNATPFSEQDMMTDVLSTQKFMTAGYNTFAGEASECKVKDAFMSLLNEEHAIQHDLFVEMKNRGWYQTENAPQNKIDQTKTKFSAT